MSHIRKKDSAAPRCSPLLLFFFLPFSLVPPTFNFSPATFSPRWRAPDNPAPPHQRRDESKMNGARERRRNRRVSGGGSVEGEVRGREQRVAEGKERQRKWERSAYEDMST